MVDAGIGKRRESEGVTMAVNTAWADSEMESQLGRAYWVYVQKLMFVGFSAWGGINGEGRRKHRQGISPSKTLQEL